MPCTKCKEGKYKWGERGECKYDSKEACEKANKDYYEDLKPPTKIVELIIEEDNQELAIDAISLVSAPAIEQDFVYFGKEKNNLTFAKVDEEKRMLVSPALIPNKQIFRYDPNTDSEYYVYFSPDTVRKASELYLKHNNHHKATYEHQDRVSGVLTVESWIKEGDSDKSKMYGFDLPNGTWFVKMRIENDDLWKEIKSGNLRGLSIEGYFTNKFEQMQKKEPTTEEVRTALKELLSKKKSIKVELASAADKILRELNLIFDDLGNQESKIDKPYDALKSVLIDWWQLLDESKVDVDDQEAKLQQFIKQVKELGIPTSEVEIIGKIEQQIKTMRFYIKTSQKVNWNIK